MILDRFANPTPKEEQAWDAFTAGMTALAQAYNVDTVTLNEDVHNYTELAIELLATKQGNYRIQEKH